MTEKIKVSLKVEIPGRNVPLRHDIQVELELDDVGLYVRGSLPGSTRIFSGRGPNTLGAILSWLSQVDKSFEYVPAYRKAGREKEYDMPDLTR